MDWEQAHKNRIEANAKKIDLIYQKAVQEAALVGATVSNFNPDKPFSFTNYPGTKTRIDKLTKSMAAEMQVVIVAGTKAEWASSNMKNDAMAMSILGMAKPTTGPADLFTSITEAKAEPKLRELFNNNEQARDAFISRKTGEPGLNLSDRVWKYTNQFKTEIEMSLDDGIRSGKPAAEMARDARQFLKEPDRVYRRFQMHLKNAAGEPVLDSKGNKIIIKQQRRKYTDPITGAVTWKVENPKYHPGRGVYKSSYKNAMRLTRTEGTMAYRTADHTRMQQFDFIVGFTVKLSNAHKKVDICDTLAGDYPKEFKFTSWHAQCMCSVTFILKTTDELKADTQRILDGEPTDGTSVNQIKSVPGKFLQWAKDNAERVIAAKTTPYFIADNYVAGDITKGLSFDGIQAEKAAKIAADKIAQDKIVQAAIKAEADKVIAAQALAKENALLAAVNTTSTATTETMLKDAATKQIMKDALGDEEEVKAWIKNNHAKPANYTKDTFYRVEGGSGAGYGGAGNGLYLGKDKAALSRFYDPEDDGLTVSEFIGTPKFLNLMHPDDMASFEKYLKSKGLSMANSAEVSKIVEKMGFDGIQYYDAMATGEEFVLFNTSKLKEITPKKKAKSPPKPKR